MQRVIVKTYIIPKRDKFNSQKTSYDLINFRCSEKQNKSSNWRFYEGSYFEDFNSCGDLRFSSAPIFYNELPKGLGL